MKAKFTIILILSSVILYGQKKDSDNDGIFDRNDLCPTIKGIKTFNGCPKKIIKFENKEFEKKYKERIRASNSNNYIREAYLNNDMLIVNDKKNASYKIEYEQNPNSKNKGRGSITNLNYNSIIYVGELTYNNEYGVTQTFDEYTKGNDLILLINQDPLMTENEKKVYLNKVQKLDYSKKELEKKKLLKQRKKTYDLDKKNNSLSFFLYPDEFKLWTINGTGKQYDKEQNLVYEGQLINGVKNGKGIEYFKKGNKYVGNFENGYKKGYGTEYKNNIKIYEGKWADNKRNGKGVLYNNDGIKIYDGEFKNGKNVNLTIPEIKKKRKRELLVSMAKKQLDEIANKMAEEYRTKLSKNTGENAKSNLSSHNIEGNTIYSNYNISWQGYNSGFEKGIDEANATLNKIFGGNMGNQKETYKVQVQLSLNVDTNEFFYKEKWRSHNTKYIMSDESAAIALVSANEAYKATKSFIQDALASSSYSNNSYSNYNSNSDNNNTVSIKRVVEIKFIGHNNQIDKGFSRCSRTANQHKIKFSDNTTRYIYQITKEESGCFGKLNEWVYLSTNWGGGIKGSTKEELIEKINKYYND